MNSLEIFDPLSRSFRDEPERTYKKLRDDRPCFWHDVLQAWVVSRHEDCHEILRNNERFSRDIKRAREAASVGTPSIQTEDPPAQLILRRQVLKALHAQDLQTIAKRHADDLSRRMEGFAEGETLDFVSDIISPVSMNLISEIVGVAGFDASTYFRLSTSLTRAMDSGLDPSRLDAGRRAGSLVREQIYEWSGDNFKEGMFDSLQNNKIVNQETENKPMNYVENTLGGVFNAGYSTTVAVTSGIIALLLDHGYPAKALSSGILDHRTANELVRYLSPAQATTRFAIVDCSIAGVPVKRGDALVVLMGSANRDPRVFIQPNELLIEREHNPHLGFAWGPHVCLGSRLALSWIQYVLPVLLRQSELWEYATDPSLLDSATLRTFQRIELRRRETPRGFDH